MKKKIIDLLIKQEYICVTCDVWSSHAQAFLGMTVHFTYDQYELQSFILALRPIMQKQTHDVMAEEIIRLFHKFGIDVEKVTHIVTDGGCAFRCSCN